MTLEQFNKKYRAIINCYKWGMCTAEQMLEAIEIYNKYFDKKRKN